MLLSNGTLITKKEVQYEGETRIDGVSDPAAPIKLTFLDALGAVTVPRNQIWIDHLGQLNSE